MHINDKSGTFTLLGNKFGFWSRRRALGMRVCSWDYYGDMFEVLMGARTLLCGCFFIFDGQVECQIFT